MHVYVYINIIMYIIYLFCSLRVLFSVGVCVWPVDICTGCACWKSGAPISWNVPSRILSTWRTFGLTRYIYIYIYIYIYVYAFKGAPLRLLKPLSDPFPMRVCACPLCIWTVCVNIYTYIISCLTRYKLTHKTDIGLIRFVHRSVNLWTKQI